MRFYRARITNVVDGDTLDADIDCGFHVIRTERVRLLGVNTPELRRGTEEEKAAGRAAKTYVEEWVAYIQQPGEPVRKTFDPCWVDLTDKWPVLLLSAKGDAFGRWLAEVHSRAGDSLAADLLLAGHATQA